MKQTWTHGTWQICTTTAPTTRQSICMHLPGRRSLQQCSCRPAWGQAAGDTPAASSGSGLSARLPGRGPQGACCLAVWAQAARCLAAEQRGREGLPLSSEQHNQNALARLRGAAGASVAEAAASGKRRGQDARQREGRGLGLGQGLQFPSETGEIRQTFLFSVMAGNRISVENSRNFFLNSKKLY